MTISEIETIRKTGLSASVPAWAECSAAISATGYERKWNALHTLRFMRRCASEVPSTMTIPQKAPTPQATGPAFHELANGTNRSAHENVR